MDADILFEEIQQFSKKAFQAFVTVLTGILLASSLIIFLLQSDSERELTGILSVAFLTGLLSIFLTKSKLITQIRTDGIYTRFPPFKSSFMVCKWESIENIFIRQYDSLREYGGWGVRWSPQGTAYTVSGNTGIQLYLKNGSKLLIGTKNAEDVAAILLRLGKLNPPVS